MFILATSRSPIKMPLMEFLKRPQLTRKKRMEEKIAADKSSQEFGSGWMNSPWLSRLEKTEIQAARLQSKCLEPIDGKTFGAIESPQKPENWRHQLFLNAGVQKEGEKWKDWLQVLFFLSSKKLPIPDLFLYHTHSGNHPLPCWQKTGSCSKMLNLKDSEHRGNRYIWEG